MITSIVSSKTDTTQSPEVRMASTFAPENMLRSTSGQPPLTVEMFEAMLQPGYSGPANFAPPVLPPLPDMQASPPETASLEKCDDMPRGDQAGQAAAPLPPGTVSVAPAEVPVVPDYQPPVEIPGDIVSPSPKKQRGLSCIPDKEQRSTTDEICKKESFGRFPLTIYTDASLDKNGKALAIYLYAKTSLPSSTGRIQVAYSIMATETGISVATIKRAIAQLVESGRFAVVSGGGDHGNDFYVLAPSSLRAGYPAQEELGMAEPSSQGAGGGGVPSSPRAGVGGVPSSPRATIESLRREREEETEAASRSQAALSALSEKEGRSEVTANTQSQLANDGKPADLPDESIRHIHISPFSVETWAEFKAEAANKGLRDLYESAEQGCVRTHMFKDAAVQQLINDAKSSWSLFLYGLPGRGKTLLTTAIMNSRGYQPSSEDILGPYRPEMVRLLPSGFSRYCRDRRFVSGEWGVQARDKFLRYMCSRAFRIVWLDDVINDNLQKDSEEFECFWKIINARADARLWTIVTTNMTPTQLRESGFEKEMSRFHSGIVAEITGDRDYRGEAAKAHKDPRFRELYDKAVGRAKDRERLEEEAWEENSARARGGERAIGGSSDLLQHVLGPRDNR